MERYALVLVFAAGFLLIALYLTHIRRKYERKMKSLHDTIENARSKPFSTRDAGLMTVREMGQSIENMVRFNEDLLLPELFAYCMGVIGMALAVSGMVVWGW